MPEAVAVERERQRNGEREGAGLAAEGVTLSVCCLLFPFSPGLCRDYTTRRRPLISCRERERERGGGRRKKICKLTCYVNST